ncbi:carbon-nitrogen hydrolase family protein [Puniceibacterium sediminis]|uniref:Predicted amidohydrolase n=1 Tax=Puniceibacterium sediminis TaxID=1608407 RepID=A0A238VQM0_9RHOB|nr:carbon-nitrogen hydrolase family protein [Puniceibacterium sediminis]SNR36662.1 Predicted amidohydrolase [Puniceibacterium sediminis]
MRTALLQITSSDDPERNVEMVRTMVRQAVADGAQFILTPEVTNCVSASRRHQNAVLQRESDDQTLSAMRQEAADLGIWLLLGSLTLKSEPPEERFANRSVLIGPDGAVAARYDKMHMFDVQVSEAETYRESSGYTPGDKAVVADTGMGRIGFSICYDLRFPYLYRALAQGGADILAVPAAFSNITGPAHWEPLLRARAIETGCYVLAPAQVGQHEAARGRSRTTYGHSMVISPWGEILLDAGSEAGVFIVDLDLEQVRTARRQIPSLEHGRTFTGPA